MRCLFGHKKKYVAIRDREFRKACHSTTCCSYTTHTLTGQEARWVCERCGAAGQTFFKKAAYKIEYGKVVLDEKRWANFT